MTRDNTFDDAFWDVALQNYTERIDIDTNDDDDDFLNNHDERDTYELHIPPYGCILLNLIPLSTVVQDNDAMAPLGAEAWYGSALLAAMFEQIVHPSLSDSCNTGSTRILQSYLSSYFQRDIYNLNILELGSGAVGLAGLVAGISVTGYMQQCQYQQQQQSSNVHGQSIDHAIHSPIHCRVILTDSEPRILQQLEHNVYATTDMLRNQYSNHFPIPELVVQHLNWENINQFQHDNHNALHLVIGSELVYNSHTARSCAQTIIQLLLENPHGLVIIVNNPNREGWATIFLSTIYKTPGMRYVLEALNNSQLHNVASNLIRPGGTLNPLSDFSVLFVWKEQ